MADSFVKDRPRKGIPSIGETIQADALSSGKMPPQNVEAEESLLGSLLIEKDAIIKIADIVTADDFYVNKNATVFSAIIDLYEKREPLDLLTLTAKLRDGGELERIGGATYLADLTAGVPTSAHVVQYAGIVSHKATLRRLIAAASNITNLGYDESTNLEDLLDKAEQTIFEVSQKNLKQNFIAISSVLAESFDRLNDLNSNPGKLRSTKWLS